MRKAGVNTKDYKFTSASKQELVEQLIVAIEQGLVGIPKCEKTEWLIDELRSFTYEVLPSGNIRYSAPEGLHDDGVIALGLAVHGIQYLLGNKNKPKEENDEKYYGSAQYWEDYYASIERMKKSNPFSLRSGQIVGKLKKMRLRSFNFS